MGVSVIRAAAVAHIHADDIAAGIPGARGDALNVARVRRALKPVNQHHGQPAGAHRLRLPVAMAEHAAAIGRVHLDRLRDSRQAEGGPGKKIPDNRLQVAVAQAAPRLKRREATPAVRRDWIVKRCIFS